MFDRSKSSFWKETIDCLRCGQRTILFTKERGGGVNSGFFQCCSFPPYLLSPLEFTNTKCIKNFRTSCVIHYTMYIEYYVNYVVYYYITHRTNTYRRDMLHDPVCNMMWEPCKSTMFIDKPYWLKHNKISEYMVRYSVIRLQRYHDIWENI